MKLTLVSSFVTGVAAHGSMSHPRPRNAYSSPATHPSSGGDKSCVGDACYWYQVGCHIGCPSCSLEGKDLYPSPHCTEAEGLMEPTNNDPEFRTWDPHGQSACSDFTKYNPWRAPGKAPVQDPCGVASGMKAPASYVEVPVGYKASDKGSEVLPETPPTYWQAGGVAQVGWGLSAQHGGGYSFRLCPKSSQLTEECFQSNTLSFAQKNSTIHFNDDSHADIKVPAKTFVAPDGTEWRTNPVPGCACDNGISCGGKSDFLQAKSQGDCAGKYPSSTPYSITGSATSNCPYGTMFEAGFDQFTQGFLVGSSNKFSIMDEVNVPDQLGEFVLGWRWDCEETDQVWNSCADIIITNGPMPAPTPEPIPAPTPTPIPSDKCATRDASKSYDCYYEGCKIGSSGDCQECCDGCNLESHASKGSYCMEAEATV